ncbi:MAG: 3-isopropylmalate dehydratase small subunit [Tannerellaceae bacterium]|jgi:3-isopropylmalate/(R)-2-methylmalate dehydratase small subunit|nr:3-isopropylmalate dehydratase small subunit [Tannerellaceae bacterium]
MRSTFTILTSACVPLPLENVDTDQIIPARFLKATTREGFGDNLFHDWRYDESGRLNPDFVLNKQTRNGEILVAGKNFGSGSSREHAAWAITGYGFRAVVSSFFADIFKNNSMNNGLLPVVVSPEFLKDIFMSVSVNPDTTLTIDLPSQTIVNNCTLRSESFEINAYKKDCLVNGLDDIDYLLANKSKIELYERNRNER